jgi:two component system regulator NtrZ-like protein (phosphatase activity inhibitor)
LGKNLTLAAISATILAVGVASAHAEVKTAKAAPGAAFTARERFAPDLNEWGPQRTQRSLQWDAKKGKWGLKLDLDQTTVRDMGWNETGAGAFYKVTPSLRVGGGVSVNSSNDDSRRLGLQQAPKVKLETAFKF